MNATEKQIKDGIGIARSQSPDIAHITIDGDSGDALRAIQTVADTEVECAVWTIAGEELMGVWGWTGDTPENWRLAISFREEVPFVQAESPKKLTTL